MIQKETASVQVLESFISSIGRRKLITGMDHQQRHSPDREKERVSPSFASLVQHNEVDAAAAAGSGGNSSNSCSSSNSKLTRKRKLETAGKNPVGGTETSKTDNSKHKKQQPKILNSLPVATSTSRPQTSSKNKDGAKFEDSLEKARALSRLYSQRNRDKQKNTIENLTQEKFRLLSEKSSLEETNKQLQDALKAAKAENQMLRNAGLLAAAQHGQDQHQHHQRQQRMAHPLFPMAAAMNSTLPPLLSSSWNALHHPTVDSMYGAAASGSTTPAGLPHLSRGTSGGGFPPINNTAAGAALARQRQGRARARNNTEEDLIFSLLNYKNPKNTK